MGDDPTDAETMLSEVLLRKAEGRRGLAKKSFGEKIAAMEALRERVAPIKAAREKTRQAALKPHPSSARGEDVASPPPPERPAADR
jgi:hypothetical protein